MADQRAPKDVSANRSLCPCGGARQYCGGADTLAPSCAAACQGQRGSNSMPRASATRSALPVGDDLLGLLRIGDQADRDRGHAGRLPDRLRQRHLIARAEGDALRRRDAAGRRVDPVHAELLQLRGEDARLLDVPAALDPVGPGHPNAHGHVGGNRGAHRLEDGEREAQAVLEGAAILVGAAVGDRREELVQQIAVRVVDLERIDAEPHRTLGRRDESLADAGEPGRVELGRGGSCSLLRHRRRCHRQPATLCLCDQLAALPGHVARRLAAGVRELHRHRNARVFPDGRQDRTQCRLGPVVVEAQVGGRDPPLGLDRGGLDAQHAGAGESEAAEMDQVPVIGRTVIGRVLAHRRDHDAVGQGQAAQRDGGEQGAHGGSGTGGLQPRISIRTSVLDVNPCLRRAAGSG